MLAAGSQWAKESLRLVFADLDVISVELLMAVVLLHDHELRVGRYASCFLLSGLGARLAQALQINVEYSTDILCAQAASAKAPSPTARESRRRLQWAVYVMDAWVGSGYVVISSTSANAILNANHDFPASINLPA